LRRKGAGESTSIQRVIAKVRETNNIHTTDRRKKFGDGGSRPLEITTDLREEERGRERTRNKRGGGWDKLRERNSQE